MTLRVTNLSKRYGDKWALKDVSFETERGAVFGVLGATGSGKSSLLNAIAGKITFNGGTVTADGGVTLLSGHVTPAGFSGLFGFREPSSSGESQLSSFKKAVKEAGSTLLLDEPFCQMDAQTRQKCFAAVRDIAKEKAVVFASSDFGQIADLTDRTAVLHNGEIVQLGTPQQIYEEPETVAVAKLAGEINIFAARRISSTNAEMPEFQTIDGEHRIHARSVSKVRLGAINQNVMLAIRPEQVAMSMGASFPEDSLIKAVVKRIDNLGATSLIHFDASGLDLKTRVFRVIGLNVGDECMLGLPPDRILVLRD